MQRIMSIYFNAVTAKFLENLKSFAPVSHLDASEETSGRESAVFTDGHINVKLVYAPDVNRFYLLRGEVDASDDDYTELQAYFFEPSGEEGADLRAAASVANEFCETIDGDAMAPVIPQASRKTSKKDRESDETSAIFFVNRIPNILPECREPLLQHKAHYDMLLPNKFCDEVVTAAVAKLLSDKKQKARAEEFFAFLQKMYVSGDMDVKSIITMTILNSITGEERIAYVEEMLSSDMNKAWRSARRFIGKEVKPEKENRYRQMAQEYRSQLSQTNQDK